MGSTRVFRIAFEALELGNEEYDRLEDLIDEFQLSTAGRFKRGYHSVHVSSKTVVQGSSEYYLIDISREHSKPYKTWGLVGCP